MNRVFLSIVLIFVLVGQGISYGQMPYHDFPPTPAFRYVGTPSGQISAKNYYYPLNVTGQGCVTVSGVNSTHTMIISGSACGSSANQGTYNTTQANNVNINVGGSNLNFINGSNGQVNVINSPGKNQVNITIGSTTPTGITSINSQTGPAITIKGAHGTSVTSSANTITVNSTIYQNNTGTNLGTSGTGVFSSMSGSVLQFLKLISANNNLVLSSNSTNVIFTLQNVLNSAIIRINGNMSANQTIATTTPITIADSGSTHTIGCSTCITSDSDNYLTSINSQTGPAINLNRGIVTNMSSIINNTNSISYQMRSNIVLTNDSAQNVTKTIGFTLANLFGNMNAHSNRITSLGTPTGSTDAQVANHLGLIGSLVLGQCTDQSHLIFNISNHTWTCDPTAYPTSAIISINSDTDSAQEFFGTSPITITDDGVGFHTWACPTCITSAVNETFANNKGIANNTKEYNFINGTGFQFKIIKSKSHDGVANQAINITGTNTGVTQLNTFTNKVNITRQNGNTTVFNNTGTISIGFGVNPVIINGAYQDIIKGLQIDKLNDTSKIVSGKDTTKAITFLNSGMTTGITTTIRNNATSSRGINIPATLQTETFAIRPQINFTASSNKTGASTTAGMLGDGVTLTPSVTGRIEVTVSAYITSSVAADGGVVQIRQITGSCVGNGVAVTGTALGSDIKITDPATTGRAPFAITVFSTGLSLGQKYCYELSQQATTGGTFTIFNVMWAAKEI